MDERVHDGGESLYATSRTGSPAVLPPAVRRGGGAGPGRLVLLAGEAGVGKSSLLEELESRVDGARWAWGACDGLFTPRPLAPLVDIAGQLGGELDELLRSGAGPDRLFRALLAEVATADVPTVLVIEDVHWADEATLDLVRFLGRRIRDAHTLILVTYRDDGLAADDELRIAVGEVSTQRSTRRMSLAPLSESAVAALAEGTGVRPDELHRSTGGNPFFVQEVLQASDGDLPTSVRDAVLARVVGLGSEARRVLEIASLVGGRMTPGFLVEVTDASATTIDELVQCGVLVGDDGRLRFRHEIARMAVQATVLPQRATEAHRRILDVLLRDGTEDAARLAHHAEGAGDRAAVLQHAANAGHRAVGARLAPRGRGPVPACGRRRRGRRCAARDARRAVLRPGRRARPHRPLGGLRRGARRGLGPVAGGR